MLEIEIEKTSDNKAIIHFSGVIDEVSGKPLSNLHQIKEKECIFNFQEIESVNSLGVRTWVNFFRAFQEGRTVAFEYCSPCIVDQINTITSFFGSAKINSFYGIFYCPHCESELEYLFESQKGEAILSQECKEVLCPKCKIKMELDSEEEFFFNFL